MPKQPVTVTHFHAGVAAAARDLALDIAGERSGAENSRLVQLRPNVYLVMNQPSQATKKHPVVRAVRKGLSNGA